MRIPPKLIRIFVCLAAFVLAVIAYSYVPLTTPAAYSSPDEAANAFFAGHWATENSLWYYDKGTIPSGGIVHPRSMTVAEDSFVVPGGFIGLPVLYGSLAMLTGKAAIPYFTPVLAILAVLAWGALVGKYMGKRAGMIAAVLLLVQPAWWYEGSRTMLPNVPFCAFLIFAAYFFFVTPFTAMLERANDAGHLLLRGCDGILAGLMLALALAIRTSEAYWLLLGGAVLLALRWKQVPWRRLLLAFVGAAVGIAPFLFLNHVAYGHFLGNGYGSVTAVASDVATQGMGNRLLGPVRPYLFPLGFAPRTALANAWTYGVAFFWWWSAAVFFALTIFVQDRRQLSAEQRNGAKLFAWSAGMVTVWLVLFYGSYLTGEGGRNASIGSSYFRYWLPVAVLSTVPLTWLIRRASEKWDGTQRLAGSIGGACALLAISGFVVFGAAGEGLTAVSKSINEHVVIADEVVRLTPDDAVIVTDTEDKYIFPLRDVIVPLRSDATYAALPKLTGLSSLYYFGITFPDSDFAYLRDVKLAPAGLEPVLVKTIGEQSLYQFRKLPKPEEKTDKK